MTLDYETLKDSISVSAETDAPESLTWSFSPASKNITWSDDFPYGSKISVSVSDDCSNVGECVINLVAAGN